MTYLNDVLLSNQQELSGNVIENKNENTAVNHGLGAAPAHF